MIGVSDVMPPRAVNQPELAVDELSQAYEGLARQQPGNMPVLLNALVLIVPLLNVILNVVFFIKDRQAHYLLTNLMLARRCGFKSISPLLDKTFANASPSALGQSYTEQNLRVLRGGVALRDQLEVHPYNGRKRGRCLTQKLVLRDARGQVIGTAGISYDLQEAHARHPTWQWLVIVDDHVRRHYHRPIAMEELTVLSGMPIVQIERCCKRIFHPIPRQMIRKVQLEKATELLAGDTPTTDIALQCGYANHGASSRQFKAMTGSMPRNFRLTLLGQTLAHTFADCASSVVVLRENRQAVGPATRQSVSGYSPFIYFDLTK